MPKFASLSAALLASFVLAAPAAYAASVPDGGLLVTRVNSEQWEIALIGGDSRREFTGSITSSIPFHSSSGVHLESSDLVTLSSTSALTMNLDAGPGRKDIARFSVSMEANLCLTGSGTPIYVGESLDDAVQVSAPVALHGVDACATGATTGSMTATTVATDALTTLATGTRKYHKGHYIRLMACCDSTKTMAASVKPGVKGFLKSYRWKELEPTQGNYNFSEIQADLTWAAANGMQLIVMIGDKSFASGQSENPAPAYLVKYTAANMGGGYTMIRWNPTVVTRFKALVTAMGARFDSHRAFEGIATQETAPSLSNTALNMHAYTPEKYRDAYIAMLTTAAAAMPTSRVFWFMNFMPGNYSGSYLAAIAAAVASKGVVMGAPDIVPDSKALQTRVYPLFDQFYGKMPLFAQVESECYRALHETSGYSTKYWTMPELFRFAKTELHLNYMFWVRIPTPEVAGSYTYFDALPVIAANPVIN